MSFEWSEKENKYTMFAGDDKEDIIENFDTKKKKSEKRNDLLERKLEKDFKKDDCKNNTILDEGYCTENLD